MLLYVLLLLLFVCACVCLIVIKLDEWHTSSCWHVLHTAGLCRLWQRTHGKCEQYESSRHDMFARGAGAVSVHTSVCVHTLVVYTEPSLLFTVGGVEKNCRQLASPFSFPLFLNVLVAVCSGGLWLAAPPSLAPLMCMSDLKQRFKKNGNFLHEKKQ